MIIARYGLGEMGDDGNTPADQKSAEADVERFRDRLGPFVVAAEKARMAMLFTNAKKADDPIVFANDAFLRLTGFEREEVLGTSFKSLMTRGAGSQALAEIEAAFAGRADREPEICYERKDGTSFWASLYISPVPDEAGEIMQHFLSFVDQTSQRERQAHCEMLIDELNHRVKNTLATVQSITRQALRASDDPKTIRESIESRIFALSRSHDLLTRHHWESAGLHDLVEAALKPFEAANGPTRRFTVEGDNIRISPKATLALSIAFHELATNAVKYGAFSNDVGMIRIAWNTAMRPDGEWLSLTWRETGGPVVVPPTRRGFGSRIVERGLAHELRGEARLEYIPEGLVCTIELPVPGRTADA